MYHHQLLELIRYSQSARYVRMRRDTVRYDSSQFVRERQ